MSRDSSISAGAGHGREAPPKADRARQREWRRSRQRSSPEPAERSTCWPVLRGLTGHGVTGEPRTPGYTGPSMPEITFLGTGTSHGIPVLACDCDGCRSPAPRDRRTRTSALVRYDEHAVLIDTATELRAQALANNVRRVDAVLMTHAHADHTGGFDDLRRFNELQGKHIPVYADPGTASMLRERYAYTCADLYP